MQIPYRTLKRAQSHRRFLEKNRKTRVLKKEKQEEKLQTAAKMPLVPKNQEMKVLKKVVNRFVKNEVPKKKAKQVT
jgi:hypothetical protein